VATVATQLSDSSCDGQLSTASISCEVTSVLQQSIYGTGHWQQCCNNADAASQKVNVSFSEAWLGFGSPPKLDVVGIEWDIDVMLNTCSNVTT